MHAEAVAPEDLGRLRTLALAVVEARPRQPLGLLCLGWLALRQGLDAQAGRALRGGLAALRTAGRAEGGPVSAELRRLLTQCSSRGAEPARSSAAAGAGGGAASGVALARTLSQEERHIRAAAEAEAAAAQHATVALDAELERVQQEAAEAATHLDVQHVGGIDHTACLSPTGTGRPIGHCLHC
jgi:hypothetical protein